MKKTNTKTTLSVILATTLTMLAGCGSDDSTPVIASTATDVTVERGKVYDATVVDSSTPAQTAVQKANQNVYTFASAPTYPITVTGGWIDVNNDGTKDTGDVPLDITMQSYSTNVTPISTYLADGNDTQREEKLQAMLDALNTNGVGETTLLDEADLLALPSQANADVIVTSNAIYQEAKLNSNGSLTNVDFDNVMSNFSSLENTCSSYTVSEEIAKCLEENVVSQLSTSGDITYITEAEVTDYLSQLETEDTTVATPTTTTQVLPDLSSYNIIYILNNTTAAIAASAMSTEGGAPEGAQSTIMATNIHCTDFGYTNLIGNGEDGYDVPGATYLDATYQKSCTEFDYSGSSYGSGTTNVVGYANISTPY